MVTSMTSMANSTNATTTSNSTSNPALLLDGDVSAATVVTVHPLVLLSVLDHHTRRQEPNGRVIGTLLGRRNGNMVEITNCFAVPHAERGYEVAIGKDFNKTMLQLHRKANRKEVVVGWYASACDNTTGTTDANGSDDGDKAPVVVTPLVSDTSSLIHDFYATEAEDGDPIHLVVDTRLLDDSIQIRGYTSSPVLIQNEPLANLFHEIKVVVQSTEAEAICLHEMHKQHVANDASNITTGSDDNNNNNDNTKTNPVSQLQASMGQLLQLLETTSSYVDDVVDGRRPADPTVGRAISNVMAQVPRILPASRFETVFHENLQDLLMVTYLSNLTRTQLDIAEKLQTSLGI